MAHLAGQVRRLPSPMTAGAATSRHRVARIVDPPAAATVDHVSVLVRRPGWQRDGDSGVSGLPHSPGIPGGSPVDARLATPSSGGGYRVRREVLHNAQYNRPLNWRSSSTTRAAQMPAQENAQ